MGIDIKGLLTRLGTGVNNLGQGISELQGDPMFNMGVGLLAAGGRRPGQRISFGQGLWRRRTTHQKRKQTFKSSRPIAWLCSKPHSSVRPSKVSLAC